MFRPKFSISNRILTEVARTEAAKEVIGALPLSADWEEKFRKDALIRSVYFNAHVDGVVLPYSSVEKIVNEEPGRDEAAEDVAKRLSIVGKERDVQTVMNYRNGEKYIDQLGRLGKKTGISFSEKESMQVHSLLMEKIIPSHLLGVYRVSAPVLPHGFELTPPLPVEVSYQMEDFWSWLSNTVETETHPILKAGIAQYEIVRIQPFIEGNLGVSRLITDLILAIGGYNEKQYFSPAEYFDKSIDDYRESISGAVKSGDLTEWLTFFCAALAKETVSVAEKVRRLSLESFSAGAAPRQVTLSERQMALLDALKMKDELTMTEARRVLPMVSDDTILRDLTTLVSKKLIRKKGRTKGARYLLRR